jgi:Flp pilus assembly protein TadG
MKFIGVNFVLSEIMKLLKHFFNKKKKSTKGQGMVEFALAFPILLMVMIGIFESGRLLLIYTTSVSASRAAARYGTAMGDEDSGFHYLDCDGMRARAINIGVLSGLEPADISISYLIPGETFP